MRTLPTLAITTALSLAACVPVEADGGLTAPYDAGLVQQAQLDGPPVAGAEAARQAEEAASAARAASAAAAEAAAAEEARAADAARAESAAELIREEEAEIARVVGLGGGVASAPAESEEPTPSGELAASSAEVAAAPGGELAGSGAPAGTEDDPIVVPPGDPEATPISDAEATLAAEPAVEATPADPAAEPASVGGAEPERGLDVLPTAPSSDAGALAALDRAALRPAPPAPDYTELAAASSAPCSPTGFDATPLSGLKLVQTWVDGTASRALLEGPKGETRTVTQGAVVGPDGARVASIRAGEVVFAEIQFGMKGEAVLVQQRLRVVAPQ